MSLAGPHKKKIRTILIIILSHANIATSNSVIETLADQLPLLLAVADSVDDPNISPPTSFTDALDAADAIYDAYASGVPSNLTSLASDLSTAIGNL